MTDEERSTVERCKGFIDCFLKRYYQLKADRLRPFDLCINSHSKSALDMLNDRVISVYEDRSIQLTSQSQADAYLSIRFNIKLKKKDLR